MRLVILLLPLLHFTISVSESQYRCAGTELTARVGKYCYYIENNPDSSVFDEQSKKCEGMSAYLAGFASLEEQQEFVDFLNSYRDTGFNPFYIGLECQLSPGFYHWSWMNSDIPYNPAEPDFVSGYDRIQCNHDDSLTHFALTADSMREDVLESEQAAFKTDLLICQAKAIDDSGSPDANQPYDDTALVIGLAVTCGILVIVIIAMMVKFRKKISMLMTQLMENSRFRKDSNAEDDEDLEKSEKSPKDPWELGRHCVDIQFANKLGTGAFGVVYLGQIDVERLPKSSERSLIQLTSLKLNDGRVAVKMLHESADRLAEADFLQEIELMKSLGYHERLANMIAAVTQTLPHLLITEFCSIGDLLSYLKDRREYMLELPRNADYSLIDRSLLITQEQQLQFSVQIACGLEYLSGRGFVHRDIAARNILIDERNGCKIGDFGLCRKVQQEQELYLSRGGRLPIKWMSPEALRRYEMSTASDVWSYGILLFEIITLGGSPYPNWEPSEILPRLEAGERMERPDNCPDAVFEAMKLCWSKEPYNRPDFTTLRCLLAKALEESPSEYYLQLDAQKDYYLVPRNKDLALAEDEFIRIV